MAMHVAVGGAEGSEAQCRAEALTTGLDLLQGPWEATRDGACCPFPTTQRRFPSR